MRKGLLLKKYKSKEICIITNCTHRQLQYWEIKGYIKPSQGQRNIRYYSDEDIKIIKNIIDLKHKGKSLGEAYVKTVAVIAPRYEFKNDLMEKLYNYEAEWFKYNQELVDLLDEIFRLESNLPRYPYFIYNQESVDRLKLLQEKAKKLKQQKDFIYKNMLNASDSLKTNKTFYEIKPEKEPIYAHTYSIDQLLLLWIKKHGSSNFSEVRKELYQRISTGESVESIIKELAS